MNDNDNSQSSQPAEGETNGEDGERSRSLVVINNPNPSSDIASQPGGLFGRLLAVFRRPRQVNLREDLSDVLAQSDVVGGDLTAEERAMLNNILRLQDVRVEDVMIARAEVEAADIRSTLGEILIQFERSGHSRMPVYSETLDDPRGMIHIRDLMGYITKNAAGRRRSSRNAQKNGETNPAADTPKLDLKRIDLTKEVGKTNIIRKVLFVPPSMMAADLMARMQATRTQMALVIDEYGGTEGLISLEDIVEMIVGDIEDEHDDEENLIRIEDDGHIRLDARAEIEDIRKALGGTFHVEDHDDDAETIGGVIFSLLGRVPVKGEVIEAFGYEIRIRDADPRRIKTIEMVRSKKTGVRKAKAAE